MPNKPYKPLLFLLRAFRRCAGHIFFCLLFLSGSSSVSSQSYCDSTFNNGYLYTNNGVFISGIAETGNNNILVAGLGYFDATHTVRQQAFMSLFNKKGQLLSAKQFHYENDGGVLRLLQLNDGSIVTFGNAGLPPNYGTVISKYDKNLNLLWEKTYQPWGQFAACFDATGNIYFTTMVGQIFVDRRMVLTKLDPNGQQVYRFTYSYNDPFMVPGEGGGLSLLNGKLIMNLEVNKFLVWYTLVVAFDPADGSVSWSKVYGSPSMGELRFNTRSFVTNNTLYFYGSTNSVPFNGTTLVGMDENGTVKAGKQYSIAGQVVGFNFYPDKSGNIEGFGAGYTFLPNSAVSPRAYIRLNSQLNVLNSKRDATGTNFAGNHLFASADGYLYEAGIIMNPPKPADFYLRKMTPDGNSGICIMDTVEIIRGDIITSVYDLPLVRKNEASANIVLARTETPAPISSALKFCDSPCDSLHLSGPEKICDSSSFLVQNQRPPGCNEKVEWKSNDNRLRVLNTTDSTALVQFTGNGTATLSASLFNGCKYVADSIELTARFTPVFTGLGPDGTICTGTSITLHAPPGFTNYSWQNGSTDSVFTVQSPGQYSIAATDYCGNVFRDTIVFANGPFTVIDLGPDRSRCNQDTLQLTAPGGYSDYKWYASGSTDTVSSQTLVISSQPDAQWHLLAGTPSGCAATGSISIHTQKSDPLFIGADTSICAGSTLVLSAGQNFQHYAWSTGASTASIAVSLAGMYWVDASSANGCHSRDTMKILAVYALPVLQLDKNPVICKGSLHLLTPGQGFASYAWSNGATQPSITVSAPGKYWVRVKDSKGCLNTDTVDITTLKEPPAHFLPGDTSICNYRELILTSKNNYVSYSWNTGAKSAAITIGKTGLYTLSVTDQDGCSGTDSINVTQKDCGKGIYFPNAFSPNGDQNNDIFRPRINGQLSFYLLRVYNRFGQLVFETNNPVSGWTGIYKNRRQDIGTYTWTCTWQFAGDSRDTRSGVLLLLR